MAWPCSTAKLTLLARYRDRRTELKAHLATLREEAADQLAALDSGHRPADLEDRFIAWVEPRAEG
ncbi:flavin reductase [Micromonospora aurantiaca (nom. illeg.)]|uniref:flavin reductase n=1 Tax=Micromonospora aurantiaca (nom. illeg.) TaxID=47850 RepID=UPI0033F0F2E7